MSALTRTTTPAGSTGDVGEVSAPPTEATAPLHARMAALIEKIRRDLQPVECEVTHHFSPGVYSRVMYIPAGITVVDKIHKKGHQVTLLQGHLTILDSVGAREVHATDLWIGSAGEQRAMYAHTPCIIMSTHHTLRTELEEVAAELVAQDALEYQQHLLTQREGA